MDIGMSQDLVAALVTAGGLVAAGGLGLLVARRARAARLRQIEGADQPRVQVPAAKRRPPLRELEEEEGEEGAPEQREAEAEEEAAAPARKAAPAAERAPREE